MAKTSDEKLDHILQEIVGINKTLEFQAKQLEEHIKRTALLENRIEPIEDHVKFLQGLLKAALYISPLIGVVTALLKLTGKK